MNQSRRDAQFTDSGPVKPGRLPDCVHCLWKTYCGQRVNCPGSKIEEYRRSHKHERA